MTRSPIASWWLIALTGLVALLWSPPAARAQSGLDLRSELSHSVVEVGQSFTVKLRALTEKSDPLPSAPQLSAPPGFVIRGPSISTQTFATFGSGGSSVKHGIGASWELIPSSPGSFTIPAPSVSWNGVRRSAQPLTVEVVPPGSGLLPSPGGSSPFLLPPPPGFPRLPSWPFGQLEDPEEADEEEVDSSDALRLPEALDKNVFLRAIVDKDEAVIGEQITISFYVYYQVDFEMSDPRQAPMSDFVRVPLLADPGTSPARMTRVGHELWGVRLIERMAIFPLRAGELETGSMSARFVGRRIGSRVLRESDNQIIRVTEPPVDDRPVGYQMGDVGQFSIDASVQPREIDQGGSVGVTIKVKGSGNLPSSLNVPARTGVDWLTPAKREEIEATEGIVGGWRAFEYVVRIKDSGTVDLGTIELPFYDPSKGGYEVASASLGAVEVTPVGPTDQQLKDAEEGERGDPFAAMPGPRTSLAVYEPLPAPLLDGWRWWVALAIAPFSVGLVWSIRTTAGAVARKRGGTRAASAKKIRTALSEAAAAEKAGDNRALAGAAERAVHASIEAATGLRSRGVMLRELGRELRDRNVEPDLADELESVLRQCDVLRFDPTQTSEDARGLLKTARAAIQKLQRVPGAGD